MRNNIERRRIMAYLDIIQARQLQSATEEELPTPLRYADAAQSPLLPSVLDRAFKGEL